MLVMRFLVEVAVILFHNHPSGNPEHSEADRLKKALDLRDIRVLDQLVIGGRQNVSLASRGGITHPFTYALCRS